MRFILVLPLIFSSVTLGESHPAWWTYASPDATALVGIERDALRGSILESAIEKELTGEGSLGLPSLDLLKKARQLLISSPDFLVIATGKFPAAAVRQEASKKGFQRVVYHEVEMWIPASPEEMSLARVSDQLLLVGDRQTLEIAIERRETGVQTSPPEQGAKTEFVKRYSPLLPRAARFAQADLWVIAAQLPDPLASRFAPIEVRATGFEGGISVRGGLRIRATLTASSAAAATKTATQLTKDSASWPEVLRTTEITPAAETVDLALTLETTEVSQFSKQPPSSKEAAAEKVVAAKAESSTRKPPAVPLAVFVNGTATAPSLVGAAPVVLPAPAAPVPRAQTRQVIRIFGLEEGVREIEVPKTAR